MRSNNTKLMGGGAFNYMERDIVFRGRRIDNSEWIPGNLLCFDNGEYRIATNCLCGEEPNLLDVCAYEVDPETVGQYIGIEDKYGAPIFEGDVVKCKVHIHSGYRLRTGEVVYYIDGFSIKVGYDYKNIPYSNDIEIIGNIYDNPELLKE